MCDLVFSLQDFLKLAPGLILLPFSIYFTYLKLSYNFSVSLTISYKDTNPEYISSITINNHKDKNVNIFAIYAMLDDSIYYEIIKFEEPLTIKSLESIHVAIPAYYSLICDGEIFKPNFLSPSLDIYISTHNSLTKCEIRNAKQPHDDIMFKNLKLATTHTKTFNGINYGPTATFAVTYSYENKTCTAIIDNKGFFNCDWHFHFNAIPQEILDNPDDVYQTIKENMKQHNIQNLTIRRL
jgi:hypothetical protein